MDDSDDARKLKTEPIAVDGERDDRLDAWRRLRGALKDVYASFGGGEAYLLQERAEFDRAMEARERAVERDHPETKLGS